MAFYGFHLWCVVLLKGRIYGIMKTNIGQMLSCVPQKWINELRAPFYLDPRSYFLAFHPANWSESRIQKRSEDHQLWISIPQNHILTIGSDSWLTIPDVLARHSTSYTGITAADISEKLLFNVKYNTDLLRRFLPVTDSAIYSNNLWNYTAVTFSSQN